MLISRPMRLERKNYYPGDYLIPVAKKYLETHKGLPEDAKELCDFAKEYEEKVQRDLLEKFKVHFDNFYSELSLHKSGKVEECVKQIKGQWKNL